MHTIKRNSKLTIDALAQCEQKGKNNEEERETEGEREGGHSLN